MFNLFLFKSAAVDTELKGILIGKIKQNIADYLARYNIEHSVDLEQFLKDFVPKTHAEKTSYLSTQMSPTQELISALKLYKQKKVNYYAEKLKESISSINLALNSSEEAAIAEISSSSNPQIDPETLDTIKANNPNVPEPIIIETIVKTAFKIKNTIYNEAPKADLFKSLPENVKQSEVAKKVGPITADEIKIAAGYKEVTLGQILPQVLGTKTTAVDILSNLDAKASIAEKLKQNVPKELGTMESIPFLGLTLKYPNYTRFIYNVLANKNKKFEDLFELFIGEVENSEGNLIPQVDYEQILIVFKEILKELNFPPENLESMIEESREYYEKLQISNKDWATGEHFSSREEKQAIDDILRNKFKINCCISQKDLPAPANTPLSNINFKIDFIIVGDCFEENNNIPVFRQKIIFVGEYFGIMKNLEYQQKTLVKIPVEEFYAKALGCGSFQLFNPQWSKQTFETQIQNGLDTNNILYNVDAQKDIKASMNNPECALFKLNEWYNRNKQNTELITKYQDQLQKYLSIKNNVTDGYQQTETYRLSSVDVLIERSRQHLKMFVLNQILKSKGNDMGYSFDKFNVDASINQPLTREEFFKRIQGRKIDAIQVSNMPPEIQTRFQILDNLQKSTVNQRRINLRALRNYLDRIENLKLEINLIENIPVSIFEYKKVTSSKNRKKRVMADIKIFPKLVRLAQIAEQLQRTDPEAANEIDQTINDIASGFPETELEESQDNFAPIETPVAQPVDGTVEDVVTTEDAKAFSPEDPGDIQDMIDIITTQIIKSNEFEDILPIMGTEEGQSRLNELIKSEVKEIAGD